MAPQIRPLSSNTLPRFGSTRQRSSFKVSSFSYSLFRDVARFMSAQDPTIWRWKYEKFEENSIVVFLLVVYSSSLRWHFSLSIVQTKISDTSSIDNTSNLLLDPSHSFLNTLSLSFRRTFWKHYFLSDTFTSNSSISSLRIWIIRRFWWIPIRFHSIYMSFFSSRNIKTWNYLLSLCLSSYWLVVGSI